MNVLIAGSRAAKGAILKETRRVVRAYSRLGAHILVGDAAGVDSEVHDACREFEVTVTVFTPHTKPRSGYGLPFITVGTDYKARDRYMVEGADRVIALWNCESSGTLGVVEYALRIGKPLDLYAFDDGTCWLYTGSLPISPPATLDYRTYIPPIWWTKLNSLTKQL